MRYSVVAGLLRESKSLREDLPIKEWRFSHMSVLSTNDEELIIDAILLRLILLLSLSRSLSSASHHQSFDAVIQQI